LENAFLDKGKLAAFYGMPQKNRFNIDCYQTAFDPVKNETSKV